ncbi:metallophosphoesterase [Pontibacter vulgaris]|uniref:metallophosphoesterase n=1 Tax=Pontibacter vulgaris TaxID=2905679 RepID=UPI001FA763EF|nr:metallophosphoesterase [Pontibacter vulgaris]
MARYALTDIHGCSRTFKALVENHMRLKKTDELYLLGDYVNKGPDSKGVIDFILHLQKQHYQVHCLRGNHDHMLLKAAKHGEASLTLSTAEKQQTLQSFGIKDFRHLAPKYTDFLASLPYFLELPDYFLVHAGFDFKQTDIFKDTEAMMNIRDYKIDWNKIGNKKILHGHTPTSLYTIKKSVIHKEQRLNLDAGCAYYKNAPYGNLVAYDLDSQELFVQPNEDKPYSGGRK